MVQYFYAFLLFFTIHELFLPFAHYLRGPLFAGYIFTSTKTNTMKKITNNANAINKSIVACTAKTNVLKSSKMFLLFFVALTFVFTSCSRNTSTGCGTWACKSNMKYSNEKKYVKASLNQYRCPKGQYN